MTKKQRNLIIGVIILVIAAFALFIPEDSSENITFEESKVAEDEDVYEKEVVIAPTINTEDSTLSESISPSPVIVEVDTVLETNTYKVVKVVDGDTIDVNINGKIERLRLIGIDTPETVDPRKPVQCYGKEASNRAKELLFNKFVALESDDSQGEKDKYGRLLRYVIMPDGINFNELMIAEGYAHEYTYDEAYKYQIEFKLAQDEAHVGQLGLWNPETCPS